MQLKFPKSPEVMTIPSRTKTQVIRIRKDEIVGYEVWDVYTTEQGQHYQFTIFCNHGRNISTVVLNEKESNELKDELEEIIESLDNF